MFSFLFGRKKKSRSKRSRRSTRKRCRPYFRRSKVAGSCSGLKRSGCVAKPFCHYVRGGQGCKYIPGGRALEGGMGAAAPAEEFFDAKDAFDLDAEPITMFGRPRRGRRYNVAGSPCNGKRKADCRASGCTYTKRGCRRKAVYKLRGSKVAKSRRGRKSSKKYGALSRRIGPDACRGRTRKTCGSNPNCVYRKRRGCVRRAGVASKGIAYEGPMMEFGRLVRRMGFGRRRSRKSRKVSRKGKKLPKAFVRKCRKHGIKTTMKRGKKRVQKKMSVLKKQLRRAMRSHRCRR